MANTVVEVLAEIDIPRLLCKGSNWKWNKPVSNEISSKGMCQFIAVSCWEEFPNFFLWIVAVHYTISLLKIEMA